ncbi:MAG TPA: Rieske (2Fe-2S) protein [Gaiellales bacterium]|jgi:nitrite reductase/ring-hydroxylating ferredoxin subunit|nr:Rieske (2Fe-2S) protein [Gaiellales bacterium]
MTARAWHDVGSEADLRRSGRLLARIGGREVGVLLDDDGAARAFRNRCPHHGAPLCEGVVRPRLAGTPGAYRLDGTAVLHCPWHGWQFDLRSGHCPEDARMRVAVYEARIEAGRVLVHA